MNILSKGWFIATLMILGITMIGFGIDFDQTQVAWKVPLATPLWITGGVLFAAGFILLCTNTKN